MPQYCVLCTLRIAIFYAANAAVLCERNRCVYLQIAAGNGLNLHNTVYCTTTYYKYDDHYFNTNGYRLQRMVKQIR